MGGHLGYVEKHQLPYNPLHDQGLSKYWLCTLYIARRYATGSRSGRWADQTKTECGLHNIKT